MHMRISYQVNKGNPKRYSYSRDGSFIQVLKLRCIRGWHSG